MWVKLKPAQARELNLEANYELVRSAFYLGYSYIFVLATVRKKESSEIKSIIETAKILGITAEDKVTISP